MNSRRVWCGIVLLVVSRPGAGQAATFSIGLQSPPAIEALNSAVPFSATVPLNDEQSTGGGTLYFEGLSDSTADFTTLHSQLDFKVWAEGSFASQNGPSAHAQVAVADQIIVTGGSGTGTLRGKLTFEGGGTVFGSGGYDIQAFVSHPGGFANVPGVNEFLVPFTFGVPTPFGFALSLSILTEGFNAPLEPSGGVAEFTVTLNSLRILGADMQPTAGAVHSTTGFEYVTAVPEPAGFVVACWALLGLAAGLRRQRRGLPSSEAG